MSSESRDLLDRVLAKAPSLSARAVALVNRVPPGSPIRRRLINLSIKRGFDAMARSDLDLILPLFEPDAEAWMRGMAAVGVDDCYRGREGVRRLYADVDEVFSEWKWTIREVMDGGRVYAIRADFDGVGRGSGLRTTLTDAGTVIWSSPSSLIARQDWFVEQGGWKKALAASGLTPV